MQQVLELWKIAWQSLLVSVVEYLRDDQSAMRPCRIDKKLEENPELVSYAYSFS